MTADGLRSPKSLAALCTDSLCRSLPYLNGALPPGLPQDVVNDVVSSLVQHSALNATTLSVLRHCELGSLTLAGCRGVSDEWLEPLSSGGSLASSSPQLCPASYAEYSESSMEAMDLDDCDGPSCGTPPDVFYNASFDHSQLEVAVAASSNNYFVEDSSCSTSSFVSASSSPYAVSSGLSKDNNDDDPMGRESPSFVGRDDRPTLDRHQEASFTSIDASLQGVPGGHSITSSITLLDLRGSQRLTDKGLLKLSDLSSLEIARMDNCYSIQGKGLLALSISHRLHTLSLANCRRLTDEAVVNISHLTSLEALSLSGCRCLTDLSLKAIACLFRMKKLDMSQCDLITDGGLEELAHLEQMEELSLGWCRSITDVGVDTLASQAGRSGHLRVLSLARIPITDGGVVPLGKLEALEELNLSGCSGMGSATLGTTLGKLSKLTTLDVSYCPGILYVHPRNIQEVMILPSLLVLFLVINSSLNHTFLLFIVVVSFEKQALVVAREDQLPENVGSLLLWS